MVQSDKQIEDQLERQSKAASNRKIEWHFAEPEPAGYFKKYAEGAGLENIDVIYTPPR